MNANAIDEKLIIRIAEKDKAAFENLYQQTSSAVYGFALSILRNHQDAEDVMHDTYIKIYTHAEKYRPQGKPMAWILTIVKNLSYNKLSQKNNTVYEIREYEQTSISDTSRQVTDRLLLEKAMQILKADERQIVILHAMTKMTYKDIAELLKIPAGSVMSKYSRALKKLKNELNEEGEQ